MEIVRPIVLDADPEAALERQRKLAGQVPYRAGTVLPRYVCATDVAYDKVTDQAHAAVVVVSWPSMEVVERRGWSGPPGYPYVPGLFSLREATCLFAAFESLETTPDVILVDGHGRAHPRRFGLACLLGWALDVPTIGCAKKVLCGEFEPPGQEAGSWSPMWHEGDRVGAALRTQSGINPVYVSPGYAYDLESAVELVLSCAGEYRIPEPLRQAHGFSVELRAGEPLT